MTEDVIWWVHQSHGLGKTKTVHYLSDRVWFPKLTQKTKRYVGDCFSCAVSVPRNDPLPMKSIPLPDGPWREVSMDYKGPIGGVKGFYYHVVMTKLFMIVVQCIILRNGGSMLGILDVYWSCVGQSIHNLMGLWKG